MILHIDLEEIKKHAKELYFIEGQEDSFNSLIDEFENDNPLTLKAITYSLFLAHMKSPEMKQLNLNYLNRNKK